MTTREKAHQLLDELPESEIEPVLEFIASRREDDTEEQADLEAMLDEEADELLDELDTQEGHAGFEPRLP